MRFPELGRTLGCKREFTLARNRVPRVHTAEIPGGRGHVRRTAQAPDAVKASLSSVAWAKLRVLCSVCRTDEPHLPAFALGTKRQRPGWPPAEQTRLRCKPQPSEVPLRGYSRWAKLSNRDACSGRVTRRITLMGNVQQYYQSTPNLGHVHRKVRDYGSICLHK